MEVGDSFGAGLPAPSESPFRLSFAQNERVFECVCLRMCCPIRGQPMVTLREWVCQFLNDQIRSELSLGAEAIPKLASLLAGLLCSYWSRCWKARYKKVHTSVSQLQGGLDDCFNGVEWHRSTFTGQLSLLFSKKGQSNCWVEPQVSRFLVYTCRKPGVVLWKAIVYDEKSSLVVIANYLADQRLCSRDPAMSRALEFPISTTFSTIPPYIDAVSRDCLQVDILPWPAFFLSRMYGIP
ncbi:hypothetical protein TNCV_3939641 [Trichonephila clavipes]|uniref:Uncharacterized protein n=1 Tax=Trichonephila clavipes TaxID=2585209 RepID=A0A8X7B8M1_TRICX|nr:hypothetical protein TNCV_3939641 [Trichonephila clavipes]